MTAMSFDSTSSFRPDARFASEEACATCFAKMNDYVTKGRARAVSVIENIINETPRDRYVPVEAIAFSAGEGAKRLSATIAGESLDVHAHALDQSSERAGLRLGTLHDLLERAEPWEAELAATNLNTLLAHSEGKMLIRQVGTKIRGILSDSYRRIDSRPTLDAIIGETERGGATIVDGIYTETRVSLKVVRTDPVEVFPGEWMLFGFDYSNSDYGDGAHEISAFLLRLWCLNGAVSSREVRRVHLGRRMRGDAFSERTLRLDAAAQASATRDEVHHLLLPSTTERLVTQVRAANSTTVEARQVEAFVKPRLAKHEAEAVKEKFASADIVELPPGQTSWRLSNAISWLAKNAEDGRRRMELERVAGEAIGGR